jgi:hypothetical protein
MGRSLGARLALGGAMALMACGASHAALIDVQFGENDNILGPTPQYTGSAVLGGANDQWNYVGGAFNPDYLNSHATGWGRTITNQPLTDTLGNATGVSLSLTTPDAFISLAAFAPIFKNSPYANLMDSFVFAGGSRLGNGPGQDGPGSVTLSGLIAGDTYRLILLSAGDVIGRATTFTLDGDTKVATPTSAQTFIDGGNYVTFQSQAGAAGSLTFAFDAASGLEGNLNGLQLLDLGARDQTPGVPEPAAWALMILGFGAAGARLRRTGVRSASAA